MTETTSTTRPRVPLTTALLVLGALVLGIVLTLLFVWQSEAAEDERITAGACRQFDVLDARMTTPMRQIKQGFGSGTATTDFEFGLARLGQIVMIPGLDVKVYEPMAEVAEAWEAGRYRALDLQTSDSWRPDKVNATVDRIKTASLAVHAVCRPHLVPSE